MKTSENDNRSSKGLTEIMNSLLAIAKTNPELCQKLGTAITKLLLIDGPDETKHEDLKKIGGFVIRYITSPDPMEIPDEIINSFLIVRAKENVSQEKISIMKEEAIQSATYSDTEETTSAFELYKKFYNLQLSENEAIDFSKIDKETIDNYRNRLKEPLQHFMLNDNLDQRHEPLHGHLICFIADEMIKEPTYGKKYTVLFNQLKENDTSPNEVKPESLQLIESIASCVNDALLVINSSSASMSSSNNNSTNSRFSSLPIGFPSSKRTGSKNSNNNMSWAKEEDREEYYKKLEKISDIFINNKINISKAEKYHKKISESGWELYKISQSQNLKAVILFDDDRVASQLCGNSPICDGIVINKVMRPSSNEHGIALNKHGIALIFQGEDLSDDKITKIKIEFEQRLSNLIDNEQSTPSNEQTSHFSAH